jgi:ferredoxin
MTHVVSEACLKCKYTDCVEVCPVSCFHEGKDMVVINPETCIDCGVCVSQCPVGAIKADTEADPQMAFWVKMNKTYANQWPTITHAKLPFADADQWAQEPDKLRRFFPEALEDAED